MATLEEKQAELDNIEEFLIENKNHRMRLKEEAKELRARHLEVEKEREQLLNPKGVQSAVGAELLEFHEWKANKHKETN